MIPTTMESLVRKIKQSNVLSSSPSSASSSFGYTSVSPSAYDTAWVAMVPHPDYPCQPMFPQCLQWVLGSQRRGGFWGQTDHRGLPTLDCLTATLACMVALNTWGAAHPHCIQQGLDFLYSSTGELLEAHCHNGGGVPRWFAIVFPGMLEVAESIGLDVFRGNLFHMVEGVFEQRRQILVDEREHGDGRCYFPLESYLEVLPAEYAGVDCAEVIASHQGGDGSLFRSPAATAFAFMATGDERCGAYLETMVAEASLGVLSRGVGVPAVYPLDEQLQKLLVVDMMMRLGIAEHFVEEIADTMRYVHSNWTTHQEPQNYNKQGQGNINVPLQLYVDALAFRLLRMHGYRISPGRFCWFLHDEATKLDMEKNYGCYLSAMLNVYRAAHLAFPGEDDLEEAKSFSKTLLRKGTMLTSNSEDGVVIFMDFQRQVEQELELAWLARMEFLEHRRFIEQANGHPLWVSKASFYKLSCVDNTDMLQLAVKNFTARQLAYRDELEESQMWSKVMGLSNIGFGREKTAYIYFSAAVSSILPVISEVRKIVTKCAVLVTVADDLYDMEGELEELQRLTHAVQRWEGGGLSGHSKIIFDALHGLVEDLSLEYINRHGYDLKEMLRNIWRETFGSWWKEAEWSRSRHAPPVDEYIKVGRSSIAIQAMILPACYLLSPLPANNSTKPHYEQITRHLMVLARLLNDLQSYEKEYLEGKLNMVMLLMKCGSAPLNIADSVARVNRLVEAMKKEFLELALVQDGPSTGDCVPREWKQLHLCGLKSFQMFFNGENAFDSPTALLHSISMAIYSPLTVEYWLCQDPEPEFSEKRVEDEAGVGVTNWLLRQGPQLLTQRNFAHPAASSGVLSKDGTVAQGGPGRVTNVLSSPQSQRRRKTNASVVQAHSRPRSLFARMGGIMFAGV